MIAPIRAVVERKVRALVDARISELATQRAPGLVDTTSQQQHLKRQARLFDLVDDESHPNTNELWVLLRDLTNAKLTIKFFGYELGRALSDALPPRTGLCRGMSACKVSLPLKSI